MNEGWRADCVSWKNKNKLWKRSKLYCQWWVCSIGQQMYAEYIFRTFQRKEEKQKKNKINSKRKQCWLKMVMLKLSFKLTILNCCVFLLFLVNCQSCWNVYFYKLACFFFPDCGKPIYFIYLFIYFICSSFHCSPRFCNNFCCCSYDIDGNVHCRIYTCGGYAPSLVLVYDSRLVWSRHLLHILVFPDQYSIAAHPGQSCLHCSNVTPPPYWSWMR